MRIARTRKIAIAAAALLLLIAPAAARAQSKTGTAVGQFLLIEPSARLAAMGNAGVGLPGGIQSVYYNAGQIGRLDRPAVQLTHSEWLAGITYDYAAATIPAGHFGNLFASVTSLNSGDIDVRTVEAPLGTGERYTVSDLALGLGYGRQVSDRFAAGAQVNYVAETIWHTSLKTVTLNVGTVYRLTESGVTVGAGIANYGATARFGGRDLAMQYDNDPNRHGDNSALPGERFTDNFPVPVLFRVGASVPVQVSYAGRLTFVADAFHPSDNTESVSLGGEWTWRNALSLRTGWQNARPQQWSWKHPFRQEAETGLTAGAGLAGDLGGRRFHFDYAWADQGRLEQTHRFTLVLDF
jgi:hypothetical protein